MQQPRKLFLRVKINKNEQLYCFPNRLYILLIFVYAEPSPGFISLVVGEVGRFFFQISDLLQPPAWGGAEACSPENVYNLLSNLVASARI